MNDTFRSLAAPLALALVTGSWSQLMAQQVRPKPTPAGGNPANTQPVRPTAQAVPAQAGPKQNVVQAGVRAAAAPEIPADTEVSEELQEFLDLWEEKSARIKTLQGQHTRTVYNLVFEVEKVADGKFYLETPDKGRIDVEGVKPSKDAKSARIGKSGKPFRIEEERGEKWICTGQEVIAINEEEKSYEIMPLPKEARGKNIVNSPLPFLFGMKADDAKRRYHITLKSNDPKTKVAVLVIVPRYESDRQNYQEAWVKLDTKTFLPLAVKLFDPSGSLETVYVFTGVKINPSNPVKEFFVGDPYHPDLRRYTLFTAEKEGTSNVQTSSHTDSRGTTTRPASQARGQDPRSTPQDVTPNRQLPAGTPKTGQQLPPKNAAKSSNGKTQ